MTFFIEKQLKGIIFFDIINLVLYTDIYGGEEKADEKTWYRV